MKISTVLKEELFRYKGRLMLVFFLQLLETVAGIAVPYMTGQFADMLISGQMSFVGSMLIVFCGVVIVQILSSYYGRAVGAGYDTRVSGNLNERLVDYLHNAPLERLQNMDTAALSDRLSKDAESGVVLITGQLMNLIMGVLTILLSLIVLSMTNMWSVIPVLILMLVYVGLYFVFKDVISKRKKEYFEAQNDFFAKQTEQLSRNRLIRMNSAEEFFYHRTESAIEKLYRKVTKWFTVHMGFVESSSLLLRLASVALFIMAGIMVVDGRMSIGGFIMISAYYGMILEGIQQLSEALSEYRGTLASLERLQEVLDLGQEPQGEKEVAGIGSVTVKDLNFSYNKEHPVFSGYQLKLEKGKIYLLKGANGRGKSTLLNILTGLYLDYTGEVLYDSEDLRDIDRNEARRKLLGLTEQEPLPVQATLRENLTLGLERQVSDREILGLMEQFGMEDFLKRQENGLDTAIGAEGGGFSGGEKQKLAIIRTLLKDAQFQIFDEPTSALDTAAVQTFQDLIREKKKDKITVIVTHDESIIDLCDQVISL